MNNEEVTLKSYRLNDKDYLVINEINYNDTKYLYLSNKDDVKDMMVVKIIAGYLSPLDDDNEINEILRRFVEHN